MVPDLKLNSIASFLKFMSNTKTTRPSLLKPLDLIRSSFLSKAGEIKIDSYQFLLNTHQPKDLKLPDNFEKGVIGSPNSKVNN